MLKFPRKMHSNMNKIIAEDPSYFSSFTRNYTIFIYSKLLIDNQIFDSENNIKIINKFQLGEKHSNIHIYHYQLTENIILFVLFIDSKIFVFDQKDIQLNKMHFKEDFELLVFSDDDCKFQFQECINNQYIYSNKEIHLNDQIKIANNIKLLIINFILKKNSNKCDILNSISSHQFQKNDFVEISSNNNNFQIRYNTTDEFLCGFKIFYKNSNESMKYFNREYNFYTDIKNKNRFIPQFYGILEDDECKYLIIEYINGITLYDYIINKPQNKLSDLEKHKIILQLIIVIQYIHYLGYCYRDLKPNNIIIDANHNVKLIDFDKARKIEINDNNHQYTDDIGSNCYMPPEQFNSEYSFKSDIYSLVMIIYSLLEEDFITNKIKLHDLLSIYRSGNTLKSIFVNLISNKFKAMVEEIFKYGLDYYPENRPTSSELFHKYAKFLFKAYKEKFDTEFDEIFKYHEELLNYLFELSVETDENNENNYIVHDIDKSMHYLNNASNDNNFEAQYILGKIFLEGKYIIQNIGKSIEYLKMSSKNGNSNASYLLGTIYLEGKYVNQNIEIAIEFLDNSSENNNSNALFLLGTLFYEGKHVSKDITKSIKYLKQSSKLYNSDAQLFLGELFLRGKYVEKNIKKAIKYLKLSSENNNSNAQFILGKIYFKEKYNNKNFLEALQYFILSSKGNNHKAQFYLGCIYYFNDYRPKDIKKSIEYFTQSANQGNKDSLYYLGIIYYTDTDVTRDIKKSINFLIKASKLNHKYAQALLGKIFYDGNYVPKNIYESLFYLNKSSELGYEFAQTLIGIIYYEGKYVDRDLNKSLNYFSLASKQNYSEAQYYIGMIYYEQKKIEESIEYLSMSANKNDPDAQCHLAYIYMSDEFDKKDIEKSIYYFTLSANQNNSYAAYKLGIMYYDNIYIPRDINKSIYYLKKSSILGNQFARVFLGVIYYEGKYVQRDIEQAIHYFKEAANSNNSLAKNNLGVIYKNGDGCEKILNQARVYFTEAIDEKNDLYSHFNLAKLLYFNDEFEKECEKSIYFMEKASERGFILATLFLFYIYFCGKNEKLRNIKKAKIYYLKTKKMFGSEYIFKIISQIYDNSNLIFRQRLHLFMENYDLVYLHFDFKLDEFLHFMLTGKFLVNAEKSNQNNIDIDFYSGFYL